MNNKNTVIYNTGSYNTGSYNAGNCNTGSYNTRNYNTGNYNTGNYNTGNYNTGNCNTGNYNTGDRNTGDRNTGDCNTNSPTVRLFNSDSGWEFLGNKHINFRDLLGRYRKDLCEWVYESKMSEKEKENNLSYKTTGGYLRVNSSIYNGKEVTKEDRDFLESIPNFCPDILKETTGIVFNQTKEIIIDGKSIEISLDSYEKLKESLL
jgi:hypothetical protein